MGKFRKTAAAGLIAAAALLFLPARPARAAQIPVEELTVLEGVYAEQMDLSGLTEEEARDRLEGYIGAQGAKTVTVDVNGQTAQTTLKDLGLTWANPETAHEAAVLGRGGSVIRRYKAREQVRHETRIFDLRLAYDDAALDKFIEKKVEAYNVEPTDGTLSRRNGSFVIKESRTGQSVDAAVTRQRILDALEDPWTDDEISVTAKVDVTQPAHDSALLVNVKDKLGSCTTVMSNMNNKNRLHNVTLASKNANGTIVWPGEEASWNDILGPRDAEHGWALAAEYVDGGSKDDYGGGICQTATTIYGALLDAEIKVTERHPHSRVVWYVEEAMDAAMSGAYKDLKFLNNTDTPLYLECYVSGNKVIYNIYGRETRTASHKVEYISEIVSEVDMGYKEVPTNALYVGQTKVSHKSYPEVKATLTKKVYENGVLVEEVLLHTDKYKGLKGEKLIGTKPRETAPAETKPAETKPEETKAGGGD